MHPFLQLRRDRVQNPSGFASALAGPAAVAVAVAGLALVLNLLTARAYEDVLVSGVIFICLSVGLQVFVGNTGFMFFGQFAYVGVGAYTAGILTIPVSARASLLPNLPAWLASVELSFTTSVLTAAAIAGLLAFVTNPVLVRVSGLAAAVASLGFMYIVSDVLREARSFTRGTQTFSGVPFHTTLLAAGLALICLTVISTGFKFSRWGLSARAGREDSVAAESAGMATPWMRVPSLVLMAAISGAGGAIWAQYLTAFSPATFGVDPAILVVVMCVLGGIHSVTGAIVGGVLVITWQEVARQVESGLNVAGMQLPMLPEFGSLTLSIGLITLLALRPQGLLGSLELQLARPKPPLSMEAHHG